MSLYKDYIQEREEFNVVESDKGFVTYRIFDNGECYLRDLYVVPAYRKSGLAQEMADKVVEIAKEANCNKLIGSVLMEDKRATENMKIFLTYGMRLAGIQGNMIYLSKNIKGEN